MTPEEIRAEVVGTMAREIASWEGHTQPLGRHKWYAEAIADALDMDGFLPSRFLGVSPLPVYAGEDSDEIVRWTKGVQWYETRRVDIVHDAG